MIEITATELDAAITNEIDLLSRRTGNYRYVPTIGVLIDQLWVR